MRGTRYGDFSHGWSPNATRYDGVLQQQGRVQLDRDWNDQSAIAAARNEAALADLIGAGAPMEGAGFLVRPLVAVHLDQGAVVEVDPRQADALRVDPGAWSVVDAWVRWDGRPGTVVTCTTAEDDAHEPSAALGGFSIEVDGDGCVRARRAVMHDGTPVWVTIAGPTPLPLRRFAHLALVCGPREVALRVDGRAVARHGSGAAVAIAGTLRFGPWHGLLGGVRVRATEAPLHSLAPMPFRGPEQWSSLAQGRRSAVPVADDEGVLAWWPCFEGHGRVLHDVISGIDAHVVGAEGTRGRCRWVLVDLDIDPGRYYVDGVACQLDRPARYTAQPSFPSAALPQPGHRYLVYLDAWERTVDAVEDLDLLDPALGGLDTTVRTEIVSTVRMVRLPQDGWRDELRRVARSVLADALAMAARHEVLSTTARAQAEHVGTAPPGNFLYRVEVQRGGRTRADVAAEQPTVRWSRTNGSTTVPVAPATAGATSLRLLDTGSAPELLRAGTVVEPLDDRSGATGVPQPLYIVVAIDPDAGTVVLDRALATGLGESRGSRPFLRVWDQAATGPGEDGTAVPVCAGAWIDLEDGIRVRFSEGDLRAGDYWWVESRQDLGGIMWPTVHGEPAALPSDGVEHRFAPLALLDLEDGAVRAHDLRSIFAPLCAPSIADRAPVVVPEGVDVVGEPEAVRELVDLREREAAHAPPQDPIGTGGWGPGTGDLAVLSRHAHGVRGFRPTGHAVEAVAHWRRGPQLSLPEDRVVAGATHGRRTLLLTTHEVWALEHPAARQIEVLTTLPSPRTAYGCCVIDDALYIVGGCDERGRHVAEVLVCDLRSGAWSRAAALPLPVREPAVVAMEDRVHVLGGERRRLVIGRAATRRHHVLDPRTGSWSEGPRLPWPRIGAAAAVVRGALHLSGGEGRWWFGRRLQRAHVALAPWSGVWTRRPRLPEHLATTPTIASREEKVVLVPNGPVARSHEVVPLVEVAEIDHWAAMSPVPGAAEVLWVGSDRSVRVLVKDAEGGAVLHELEPDVRYEVLVPAAEGAMV